MTYKGEDRFPIEAIINFDHTTARQVAELLGASMQSIQRYKNDGIPRSKADQLAIAMDLHPCAIWPDFYEREMA